MAVALLESWGILGNIVFKLLYKLRPALTHRPTLTLSSMLRFFCHCILLFLIAKTKIELRKIPSGWGKWGKGRVYPREGGVLLGILGGGVPPGSSNPDPISDQKMWFSSLVFTLDLYNPCPFSDLAFRQKLCYHYLIRLGRKHKNYSNLFGIRIFLFLSYSFGIETGKMFIHSRSSLENPTRFQTKMGKVYTRFQTKTAQKPYPMGLHISIWLI